jgi:hypothetical protein
MLHKVSFLSGSFEYGNELSGSIKRWEFLEQLIDPLLDQLHEGSYYLLLRSVMPAQLIV